MHRPGDPGLLRALLPRVQCVSEFPLVANLAQQQREGSPGTTPLRTRAEERSAGAWDKPPATRRTVSRERTAGGGLGLKREPLTYPPRRVRTQAAQTGTGPR